MNLKKSRQLINSRTPCMWKSCVVYIERIRRSPQIQALCEIYKFHTNRQTGQEKADQEWHRSVSSIASGMRKHIRIELTFFIQQHREKPKGRLFSELLEDECPFLLFKAKEKIKNGKEQLVLSKDEQKISDFCSSLHNLNFKTNLLTPI